jgi:hypothetical protein
MVPSVGIIVIDAKRLMLSLMSYYDITIHTTFSRLFYIYDYIRKGVHVKK